MKKATEIIQRIESPYVREDYIQTIVKYKNAITILGQDGVQLHCKANDFYINQYLEDGRRNHFPYANIPMHYTREKICGDKICHVNQIFEFDKPYIELSDGNLIERYIIKDNKEAILIKKAMPTFKRTAYLTREELENRFLKTKEEQTYYFDREGLMLSEKEFINSFPTEEQMQEHIQGILKKNIQDFREYQNSNSGSMVASYLEMYPIFLDYYEKVVQNMDLSIMNFDIPIIGFADSFIIAKIKDNKIMIEEVEIYFEHMDYYKVVTYDIPITKYTLEQLKFVSKMSKTKEPKIPLRLNPGLTKQDIQEAQQMARTLRK